MRLFMTHCILLICPLLAACTQSEAKISTPFTATSEPPATTLAAVTVPPTLKPTSTPRSTSTREPTFTPVPTAQPQIEPVAAGDIVFFRLGPNDTMFVVGMQQLEVWAMKADGSDQRKLMDYYTGGGLYSIAPSPDGQMLALNYDAGVVVLHLLTGEVQVVSESNRVIEVRWSADSSTLYYSQFAYDHAARVVASRIWRKQFFPEATEPEMILEAPYHYDENGQPYGERLSIGAALPDGRFVLYRCIRVTECTTSLYDPGTATETPIDHGVFVHDASQNGSRVLLSKGEGSNRNLYLGSLQSDGGIGNLQPVEVQGSRTHLSSGQFLPGGNRILAQQDAQTTLVMLVPREDGTYTATSIGETTTYLDFLNDSIPVMVSNERILQERFAPGGFGKIWWLPLDGSEGIYLADGYRPLIVGEVLRGGDFPDVQ